MTTRALIALGLFLVTAAAGCVVNRAEIPQDQGDRLTVGKVQGEIKVGISSVRVLEILGTPNIVTTDEKRREVWVYDRVSSDRVDTGQFAYGTLIIVGGSSEASSSSTRQRTLTVIIKFDEEKKVRDFAYNYTQF